MKTSTKRSVKNNATLADQIRTVAAAVVDLEDRVAEVFRQQQRGLCLPLSAAKITELQESMSDCLARLKGGQ